MDSGLGNQGGENSEQHTHCVYALRSKSENTERINDLANNEDSNVSSKVAQNDAIETDLNLQVAATSKIGICKHCGKPFEKRTTWHVFCVEQCRLDYHGVFNLSAFKKIKRRR